MNSICVVAIAMPMLVALLCGRIQPCEVPNTQSCIAFACNDGQSTRQVSSSGEVMVRGLSSGWHRVAKSIRWRESFISDVQTTG
jgi:hypothetical protein